MPRLRQGGVVGILQSMTQAAEDARKALSDVHLEVSGIGDEAERLSRITPSAQPATFGPPDPIHPRPGESSPPTVLDPSGRPITRSGVSGGASVSSGGSGGGGGRRTVPDVLSNLDGTARMPREWVEANCVRIKMRIPRDTGARAIPGDIGNFKEVDAWQCPAPYGTFLERVDDLPKMSARSSGGAGVTGGTSLRDRPGAFDTGGAFFGRNAGGSGISGNRLDRTQGGEPTATSDGLSQLGTKIDRTNTLLDKIARGDGGASLRANGGI